MPMASHCDKVGPMAVGMVERYEAAMVLSGVGDAMGYKNGGWEFCKSGTAIHHDLAKLGGVEKLEIRAPDWIVSDDTVMHLATAEALLATPSGGHGADKETLNTRMARKYIKSMRDMDGRAPGITCSSSCHRLQPERPWGCRIPFNLRGGGCGAAMRAMCIGLRYPRADDLGELIQVSIESGRLTHHHPTGYLGAMAAALFTAYSIQEKPLVEWGVGLMSALDSAYKYIQGGNHATEANMNAWGYFKSKWREYLKIRQIENGDTQAVFPEKYDVKERDAFYKSLSFSGTGGASGHDAPMIAYDALLNCQAISQGDGIDWTDLCHRAMLHGGDNDSTGVIAGACYGAMYGFRGVPDKNHSHLEYRKRLMDAGRELYKMSHTT